jgi:glycine/D-amino acid oxidase-like deaminating enzyme
MPEWTGVIAVGCGGAGASAALAARMAGASVLVVEKDESAGGSTREAGGSLRPPAHADVPRCTMRPWLRARRPWT